MSLETWSSQRVIFIIFLIFVASISTMIATSTAIAESESDLQWANHSGTVKADDLTTQSIIVVPGNEDKPISFGADTGRSIRIQNVDTRQSITLTSTSTTTHQVTEFRINFNDLVDSLDGENYSVAATPSIQLHTKKSREINNYPVTVKGDFDTFFEQTFSEYTVQLTDSDGTVLTETPESKIRGVGYEAAFAYNGSAVGIKSDKSVEPGWHVVLIQSFQHVDTTINSGSTGNVVLNTQNIDFEPNSPFRVYIFQNASRSPNPEDVIIMANSFNGFEDAETDSTLEIVDGAIGTDTNQANSDTSTSAPGFSFLNSFVALSSAGYLIKRRLTRHSER